MIKSKLSNKFWIVTQNIFREEDGNEIDFGHEISDNVEDLENAEDGVNLNGKKLNLELNNCKFKKKLKSSKNSSKSPKKSNENDYEMEYYKNMILQLRSDVERKDFIISKQKEEKFKLSKRVEGLEKLLNIVNYFFFWKFI